MMTDRSSLDGRTALVTGGAIGIGEGIALELASRRACLAITYRTHTPDDALLERLHELSGFTPVALPLDATDDDDVGAMAARLAAEFGRVDILVNNVGSLVQRADVIDMDYELWRRVHALNLDSTFLVTHHLLPWVSQGSGRIINIASLAGRNGGGAGAAAYAAAKAGLFGFTRALAKELAPRGITVNAVAPGFIESTSFHDTFTTADAKAAALATIPDGRAGVPADVATAVAWLAHPDTGFITGVVIDVNGGQYFA